MLANYTALFCLESSLVKNASSDHLSWEKSIWWNMIMIFPLRYVFVFFYLSAIVVGFDDLLTCVPYDHPTPHPPALWTCLQPWQASTQVSRLSPASSSSSTVRRPPREWWDTPCRRVRLTVFLYQAHSDVKWPVVFFFFLYHYYYQLFFFIVPHLHLSYLQSPCLCTFPIDTILLF